ncbi:PepSY domain-containing protein [Streptomyces sp. NPDC048392]|uniref:PepSY domain-containing protein n=1 Tax=Streptomyces sp. NPDC048392 TaxID=3365543 RepID=UPI003711EFF4
MLLALMGALLAACSGPAATSRPEVLGQVEFPFDRAVRKALDEVPESRLFSIGLRQVSGPHPEWHTEVATSDGTVHVVRVDAVLGRLLGTSVPPGQSPAEKEKRAALVEDAKVLPEEAAEKAAATAVKSPHYGKVTDVRLAKDRKDGAEWLVTVATIEPGHRRVYVVDAVTGNVLDSRTDAPSPSSPADATVSP